MRSFLRFLVPVLAGVMILVWWNSPPNLPKCSEWAEIPYTPAQMIDHKFIHPGNIAIATNAIGNTPAIGSQAWQMMAHNFELLVDTLHDVELREQIKAAIISRDLSIDFIGSQYELGDPAQFIVSPDGKQGQLVIGTLYMSRLIDDYTIAYVRMAIIHEFEHYRQWKRSAGGEHELFNKNTEATEQDCRWLWQHELEAWSAGCRYFLNEGIPFVPKYHLLCEKMGNLPAFTQQLYQDYSDNEACVSVFAEEAGCSP